MLLLSTNTKYGLGLGVGRARKDESESIYIYIYIDLLIYVLSSKGEERKNTFKRKNSLMWRNEREKREWN